MIELVISYANNDAMNGGTSGRPMFGVDLGFFVFTLPWLSAMANFAFGVLFLTSLVTVGIYVGMQALAIPHLYRCASRKFCRPKGYGTGRRCASR